MKGDLGSSKLEIEEGTVADRGFAESLFECGEDLFFSSFGSWFCFIWRDGC